jgi:hypothetical protein
MPRRAECKPAPGCCSWNKRHLGVCKSFVCCLWAEWSPTMLSPTTSPTLEVWTLKGKPVSSSTCPLRSEHICMHVYLHCLSFSRMDEHIPCTQRLCWSENCKEKCHYLRDWENSEGFTPKIKLFLGWTKEMALQIKSLPLKHEDLSLDPQNLHDCYNLSAIHRMRQRRGKPQKFPSQLSW